MGKITPFLWFDDRAEEAANFYASIFDNAKILGISRYGEGGPGPAGSVMTASFVLDGQEFIALNGGPHFKFTEAISFLVEMRHSGGGRRLLGEALRRRRAWPMRLAEGQVRGVVANRPGDAGRDAAGSGPRESRPCYAGDAVNGKARHRRLAARLRARLTPAAGCGAITERRPPAPFFVSLAARSNFAHASFHQLGLLGADRRCRAFLEGEGQLVVVRRCRDPDDAALGQLAEQQLLGERLLDVLLDDAGERPGAEQRVVALLGQPVRARRRRARS